MELLPVTLTAESGDHVSLPLEAILARVPGMPPATHLLPKLLMVLRDADTDIDHIVELLAFDPGLTVKLIRLCNSAALGGEIRVTDVGQAVNRLGLNSVFKLVAALTGNSVLKSPAVVSVLDVDRLWEHSVMVALAASLLAKDKDEDDSAAFTSGLLHESGKIVMAQAFQENYEQMLTQNADSAAQLVNQERLTYGFDYPEAGGRMLARGAFPEVIVASITYQHRPGEAQAYARAAALLSVANTLASRAKHPEKEAADTEPAHPEALKILDLTSELLPFYCERLLEEFKFANALCHL